MPLLPRMRSSQMPILEGPEGGGYAHASQATSTPSISGVLRVFTRREDRQVNVRGARRGSQTVTQTHVPFHCPRSPLTSVSNSTPTPFCPPSLCHLTLSSLHSQRPALLSRPALYASRSSRPSAPTTSLPTLIIVPVPAAPSFPFLTLTSISDPCLPIRCPSPRAPLTSVSDSVLRSTSSMHHRPFPLSAPSVPRPLRSTSPMATVPHDFRPISLRSPAPSSPSHDDACARPALLAPRPARALAPLSTSFHSTSPQKFSLSASFIVPIRPSLSFSLFDMRLPAVFSPSLPIASRSSFTPSTSPLRSLS
ncbi:hypothetical protein C8R44DRAFT_993009 [Mycena epipterygia]|nr:hypothetical protein C8R44DRAFT_993009 [Mycena epipterygia]